MKPVTLTPDTWICFFTKEHKPFKVTYAQFQQNMADHEEAFIRIKECLELYGEFPPPPNNPYEVIIALPPE